MRNIAAVVLAILLGGGCADGQPLPEPAAPPQPAQKPGPFTESLLVAEHRYARGVECGTQYMFEMADLAKKAPAHLPELVGALKVGVGDRHALFILHLMQERALLALPLLDALSRDSDPVVQYRAREGIEAALEAAEQERRGCGV